MYRIIAAFAATVMIGTVSTSAVADPPQHALKSAKHVQKKAHKASKHVRFKGGPPPWAPAHGFRRKAGYYDNLGYRDYGLKKPPIDLAIGRCNRDIIGQVLGGGLGAVAGSQIGSGSGRLVAVATGTIIGVLVGGEVGRRMDRVDALCVDQALENAPDGETVVWNNARQDYSVTPTQTVTRDDGQYCRDYIAEATVDGRPVQTHGTACRQPDGAWKLMS
jgi:surface antigen